VEVRFRVKAKVSYRLMFTGVSFMTRKVAASTVSTVQLVDNGDGSYTFHTSSTFKNQAITFRLGESFAEETLDGRKIQSKVTFEDGNMIQEQGGDKPVKIVRQFTAKELVATISVGSVVSKRWFTAID